MSSHPLAPHAGDAEPMEVDLLRKHSVSQNGFLPAEAPLSLLPDPYHRPWEDIIHQLPLLLRTGQLRHRVDSLETLSVQQLATEAEWRRAYVILAFLAHAYVWAGPEAAEVLPSPISIPLLKVADRLDLPPVLAYAASNLWNFTSAGTDFTNPDELRCLHTFTGTDDEHWFFTVSVAMECQAASIMPVMIRALDAVERTEYDVITDGLRQLSACIDRVGRLLERMYERCDPDVFYHQIRPFLAGSKNMEAAGLPRGLFYPEPDGRGSWRQYRGGSNGQSSMIQFFDVVLGVQHRSEGDCDRRDGGSGGSATGQRPSFHQEVRSYMPAEHRRLLEHMERMGSVRDLARRERGREREGEREKQQPATAEQQHLCAAYERATQALAEFRNKHIRLVTRYIILPSKRAQTGRARPRQNLAAASSRAQAADDGPATDRADAGLKGTGGTTLLPFLKLVRDETLDAGGISRGGAQLPTPPADD